MALPPESRADLTTDLNALLPTNSTRFITAQKARTMFLKVIWSVYNLIDDKASLVTYDNSISGLTATQVSAALDELAARSSPLISDTKTYANFQAVGSGLVRSIHIGDLPAGAVITGVKLKHNIQWSGAPNTFAHFELIAQTTAGNQVIIAPISINGFSAPTDNLGASNPGIVSNTSILNQTTITPVVIQLTVDNDIATLTAGDIKYWLTYKIFA